MALLDVFARHSDDPFALSALEFDVLWQHLGLGDQPLVIRVDSPGRTFEERSWLEEAAWRDLGQRGLGCPGAVHGELRSLLRRLERPDVEVDGRLWLGERRVRVLAAATRGRGALAVLEHKRVTLRAVEGSGLARAAVGTAPARPAGPGHSVTLRAEQLDSAAARAGGSADALRTALCGGGVREEDARTLAEMVREAGDRGQFGVARRDSWGSRRRLDRVIAFFDTPKGRYLQTRRGAPDGSSWSVVSPVDSRRLVQHVEDMLSEVRGQAAAGLPSDGHVVGAPWSTP
ncbi:ESX secretion-associated protein EspG [Actinoalloteichus sp. AHMU CJ021]|uniref:EspG family protein n=1 Tax=Actinoalloteichus caeruleus DSM 43889 TaxID=1120930 RepID=A0ABT1JN17_ACTCY|nr:ESX secretion-associated protein EspG [Actinoalloteichus caeruleus]AUS79357.1 ESX secretion-associated protein EspG [Actinoalloteichus sp. AHMU CJ021]MCP2333649.1 EspG family protein [Actinoalloteichus caeruleus DSM 43889]